MTELANYHWPNSFWPAFIKHYWQQKPISFECPSDLPFISLAELFKVVAHMPSSTPSDRFWIVKNSPPKSKDDFRMGMLDLLGPKAADDNFEGYFQRLNRHTAGINIHNLNAAKPDLLERVTPFIKHLSHTQHQAPAMHWGLDTFFGTYHATPFGIHRDNASVFSFILKGERTYATWPAEYFTQGDRALQTPDMSKIKPHLNNAELFTVKAGDIFYWPSNRWHVAMSNGAPSVVAQISAYFNTDDLDHWN